MPDREALTRESYLATGVISKRLVKRVAAALDRCHDEIQSGPSFEQLAVEALRAAGLDDPGAKTPCARCYGTGRVRKEFDDG